MRQIEYIIIHHTGRNNDFPAFVKFRHLYLRKWEDVGYHYLIGNRRPFTKDGHLYAGRPENHAGAHAKGYNESSLGVCLIGNLDKSSPSPKQMGTLIKFLEGKKEEFKIPTKNILGHHELPNITKSCPGKNLDIDLVRWAIGRQFDLSIFSPKETNPWVPDPTVF